MKISLLLLFLSVVAISLFVLFLNILKMIVENRSHEISDKIDPVHKYKFYKMDPDTSEGTAGFMTLIDDTIIKEQGYMEYEDGSGSTIIVSEFGSTLYECTGTCYCETDHNERRIRPLTVKVIKWYVILGTTFVVGNFFYNLFFKRCEVELGDTCDPENVRAEGEECVPLEGEEVPRPQDTPPDIRYDDNESESPIYKVSIVPDEVVRDEYYYCTGNCQPRMTFQGDDSEFEVEARTKGSEFGCEGYQLDMNIDGHLVSKYFRDKIEEKGVTDDVNSVKNIDLVKAVFGSWHLSAFCTKSSVVYFKLGQAGMKQFLTREVPVCDAGHFSEEEKVMMNPTVQCVKGFISRPKRAF